MVSKHFPQLELSLGDTWVISQFFNKTILLLSHQIPSRNLHFGWCNSPFESAFLRQLLVNYNLPKCIQMLRAKISEKHMFDDSTPLLLIVTRCPNPEAIQLAELFDDGALVSHDVFLGPRVVTSNICRKDWDMGMGQKKNDYSYIWVNKHPLNIH